MLKRWGTDDRSPAWHRLLLTATGLPSTIFDMAFVHPAPVSRLSKTSSTRQTPLMCQVKTKPSDEASSGQETRPENCPGCGRAGGPVAGCNGEGRIIGGLGAVVSWWPIKAYRPCPDYLNTKKKYQRAGQSLDEIAFGRKGQDDDKSIRERLGGK